MRLPVFVVLALASVASVRARAAPVEPPATTSSRDEPAGDPATEKADAAPTDGRASPAEGRSVPGAFVLAGRRKAGARSTPKGPVGPPEVLFTFDDGPHLERTPKVLDTLDRFGVKAVFFVNGMRFRGDSKEAQAARALLREIVRRGHAVGNHTVNHKFLCGVLGPKIAEAEIEDNARLIQDAIGFRPELFRTPYGSRCKSLSTTLERLGVRHTHWDIDPQDWRVQNTRVVRDYVIAHLKRMHGRQIVLMHDIHADTVEALPQILDWLVKENAGRVQRGERPVRVLDYGYLLTPRPSLPPFLDGLGRVLIDAVGATPPLDAALRWLSRSTWPRT